MGPDLPERRVGLVRGGVWVWLKSGVTPWMDTELFLPPPTVYVCQWGHTPCMADKMLGNILSAFPAFGIIDCVCQCGHLSCKAGWMLFKIPRGNFNTAETDCKLRKRWAERAIRENRAT